MQNHYQQGVLKIPKKTTLAIIKPTHGPLKKGACEVRQAN
jgi:hypothetical protein